MTIIDTHAHLYVDQFQADRPEMMARAAKIGVGRIIFPAIDSETHDAMLEMEDQYPEICRSMMGLHPCSVKEDYLTELAVVKDWLDKRSFCAIGEIGLDFYWDKTYTDQQYAAFRQQTDWAIERDLPIAIHSRNATDECIDVLEEYKGKGLRGVLHCFSGTAAQAQRAIATGFYLGIGGVLTFKNSGLDKAIENIPLEKLVLETDAPYLAPVPFRGKRNESSYLSYIISKLSEVKGVSEEEIASITTINAQNLFKL